MILGVKLVFALLFLWGIFRLIDKWSFFKNAPFSAMSLKFAFSLKVVAGGVLVLLYTFYYTDRQTADVFKYYDDGEVLCCVAKTHPLDFVKVMVGIEDDFLKERYLDKMSYWYRPYDHGLRNDNRIVIRINAVLHLVSFGNYYIHALVFIFLSFLGCLFLAKLFFEVTQCKISAFISAFLVPSVFLWSSGVLKEALLIFALGVFCWSIYRLSKVFSWTNLVLAALAFFLLFSIKIYVFVALLPALIFWFIWMKQACFWKASLLFGAIFLGGFFFFHLVFPQVDLVSLLVAKQHDFIRLSQEFKAGSTISMRYLENDFWSILASTPQALFHTFTLPWFWHVKSLLYLPSIIENMLVFILCVLAIVYFKRPDKLRFQFLVFSGIFILSLFTIIGLTTPVIGALVRYKVPALPFLFFVFLSLTNFLNRNIKFTQHKAIKWINMYL